MAQRTDTSRRLPANPAGAAWEFDVEGQDVARVSMAGFGAAITTAQFTVYGTIDGAGYKATGEVLTPAEPVSDEISVSTFRKLRVKCTTAEGSALDVILTCRSATTSR